MDTHPAQKDEYDPIYVHAKREARWILVAWAVCLVWTVGYSALFGYEVDGAQMQLIMGIPSWVFWGVFIPWMGATLFSVWFGLVYMKEDDLHGKSE